MTLKLTLREAPSAPLSAPLRPDRLAGLSQAEIEGLSWCHGNQRATVGELFDVSGAGEDDVRVVGHVARVAGLGTGMAGGRLTVEGSAGPHVGAGMTDGELVVEGDAGDWAGAEMHGGRLVVRGSAGRRPRRRLRGDARRHGRRRDPRPRRRRRRGGRRACDGA